MLSLREKLSLLSLFWSWRASVPGKVSRWKSPPLHPEGRAALSWLQPPPHGSPEALQTWEPSSASSPCCIWPCPVVFLPPALHAGCWRRGTPVLACLRDALTWWMLHGPALLRRDGGGCVSGGQAAPIQSHPVPRSRPGRSDPGLPCGTAQHRGKPQAEPGLRPPPGAAAGHPAPAPAPAFGTLNAFLGMSCGTGRGFPATLSSQMFSTGCRLSVEGPILCRVPRTAQPGDSRAWERREAKVQPSGSPRTTGDTGCKRLLLLNARLYEGCTRASSPTRGRAGTVRPGRVLRWAQGCPSPLRNSSVGVMASCNCSLAGRSLRGS